MRTTRLLTLSRSIWGGYLPSGVSVHEGGCVCLGQVSAQGMYPSMQWVRHPPWTESQTGVKTLPCPKLHLRAVKIHRKRQYQQISPQSGFKRKVTHRPTAGCSCTELKPLSTQTDASSLCVLLSFTRIWVWVLVQVFLLLVWSANPGFLSKS